MYSLGFISVLILSLNTVGYAHRADPYLVAREAALDAAMEAVDLYARDAWAEPYDSDFDLSARDSYDDFDDLFARAPTGQVAPAQPQPAPNCAGGQRIGGIGKPNAVHTIRPMTATGHTDVTNNLGKFRSFGYKCNCGYTMNKDVFWQ